MLVTYSVFSSVYGGWSGEDHLHFCHIVEQYPADIPQRRSLWMDRLRREMPQLSRQQLVGDFSIVCFVVFTHYHDNTVR